VRPLDALVMHHADLPYRLPIQLEALAVRRTVTKVQIDQRLVWDTAFAREFLEVPNCLVVEADGHLSL
jgi:hypothetical protein